MPYLLALTLLLTPTYAMRSDSLNLLMVWVVFIWFAFAIRLTIKKEWKTFWQSVKGLEKPALMPVSLLAGAGTLALFVQSVSTEKLGQYLVLFIQPVSLFFLARYTWQQNPAAKTMFMLALYGLLGLAGMYALTQYFTLTGLPSAYWGNSVEPKRAISFFLHPNFYALFNAPLLAFLIPDVAASLKSKIISFKSTAWLLGTLGLFFSLSRAGWLGLTAAVGLYAIVAADAKIRKIIFAGVMVIIIVIIIVPNFRYRLLLPFHREKSAVSRLSLWESGWKGVRESPIAGLGLKGFSNNWQRLNTDPNIDTHNYPHNVFLNFWVETGLPGLVGFLWLAGLIIVRGLRPKSNTFSGDRAIILGTALFLTTLLTQGLIDNPYFKNDLAMVFWLILSLAI